MNFSWKQTRLIWSALFGALLAVSAHAIDGTYHVTEEWSVTLEYDGFGRGSGFTGTKHFSGRESGTIVISGGEYRLINRSGFAIQGTGAGLLDRSISCYDSSCGVSGSYAFGPGYNARAYGILFLGCFVVKVPLIDGEVPIFYDFDRYGASGTLNSMRGYGAMLGDSLRVTVSSRFSLTPKETPATAAPHIAADPRNRTVDFGRRAVFSVRANGSSPLMFQWWKDGVLLEGANASTLVLPRATEHEAGNYRVTVWNAYGSVTSEPALLAVRPPIAPMIKRQPLDRMVPLGQKLRLNTRAKGSAPLDYQWYFNGSPVPGANTNSFVVPVTAASDEGNYFAVVSNAAGSATSRVATVTISVPAAARE